MTPLQRVRALLAGLWAGMLWAVGALAAPALFATLDRVSAGRTAGQIFTWEAYCSLGLAVALLGLERMCTRAALAGREPSAGAPAQFTLGLGLLLLALACTVAGHFGLQPMIAAAKAGEPGAWSFAALHGASTVLFGIKALAVLLFAWHSTRAAAAPRAKKLTAAPSS